ncbi:MAG: amino acid ABC transporter ATP-binding protein [Clostridiales Family XIII bacterium]|jgi:L-cystine transport system ATP-binding protein|nr:amino acid ABC transporter ATP-binding protein [Clostridiales Family XIII bacterium]
MIEVKGLKKAFGQNQVLKGVGFHVNEGDVMTLLGVSGSGKTTLIRCLNYLESPDEGVIRIDDRTVDAQKITKKEIIELRKKTAMVFQTYDLFLNLNALQNVTEGLIRGGKIPKPDAEDIARDLLEKVGLSAKLESKPYQLSGGEQQRVGIARALALCPKVILFDEPTSALDPEVIGEILDIIKAVARSGVTMIIVTHEMEFAFSVSNKVVFIDQGEIVEEGSPREVFLESSQERTKSFLARSNFRFQPEYYL